MYSSESDRSILGTETKCTDDYQFSDVVTPLGLSHIKKGGKRSEELIPIFGM